VDNPKIIEMFRIVFAPRTVEVWKALAAVLAFHNTG
jgi:hypothetical protein